MLDNTVYQPIKDHMARGALMHGLQGADGQGPTLERGATGCKEIIFFE